MENKTKGLIPFFFCAILSKNEILSMDRGRLKDIIRTLELAVDALKAEVYSDVEAYKNDEVTTKQL